MTALTYIQISVNIGSPKRTKKLSFVSSGVTLFFNTQHLFIQLNPKERALFDYLCERMNKVDNSLRIDTKLKEDFIRHISKITGKQISPSIKRVTSYLKNLVTPGLLILNGDKLSESYFVNPKYVFKGTAKQRIATIKLLIESRDKLGYDNTMLVNTHELK